MKLVPLHSLFEISYGNSFDLTFLEECSEEYPDKVNYVSRTRENNGVSAFVKRLENVEPFEKELITVAGSGNSVLESFIQPLPFYTGYHVFILKPKVKLSHLQKLFYCFCIRKNQYKYNFGRQANKTLKDILVPPELPEEFKKIQVENFNTIKRKSLVQDKYKLNQENWKWFRYDQLFTIEKGKRIVNSEMRSGNTRCIRPIDSNNGVYDYIDLEPNHKGNTITVNYNGSVAEAFYQSEPYFALDDVNVLYPKFELNVYIAMFIITLIRQEKYRFNYGRKWNLGRMNESLIKLPVNESGKPDFEFMENYIKSLPYSSNLTR
jgi:Type I restriction modification DNA specificity domain